MVWHQYFASKQELSVKRKIFPWLLPTWHLDIVLQIKLKHGISWNLIGEFLLVAWVQRKGQCLSSAYLSLSSFKHVRWVWCVSKVRRLAKNFWNYFLGVHSSSIQWALKQPQTRLFCWNLQVLLESLPNLWKFQLPSHCTSLASNLQSELCSWDYKYR